MRVIHLRRDFFVLILSVAVSLLSIAGFVHVHNLYYVFMGVFGLFIFSSKGRKGIHLGQPLLIVFLLACLFSIMVNNPPSFFRAWERLGLYCLILIIVSPIVVSPSLSLYRRRFLECILYSCVILSVGSFFAYFLNINLFDRGEGYLEIEAGNFSGLMNHSIVLGHFAGLSTAYMFSKSLNCGDGRRKILFFAITFMCFAACLLSASRNGVLSCIFASIIAFLLYFKTQRVKGLITATIFLIIIIVTFPLWGNLTGFLIEKNNNNVAQGGSVVFSREQKFDARLQEFKSSPIFGIGFCTVDPSLDKVNFDNGQVEPGSSWLAVASMTGILGLIPFLIITISSFRRTCRKDDKEETCILSSLLFFYLIHLISEGYIFAPRSFLSMVFWLIIGASYSTMENYSKSSVSL